MITDEKRIINKGTDPLGHNTHREGRGRLTELAPQIKNNHNKPWIHQGFAMIIAFKKYTIDLLVDGQHQSRKSNLNTINLVFTRICNEK